MDGRGEYQKGTRVYVGGLSQGTKKEDLETEFEKFGKLNNVWVAFNPPGFAFIEFSNKTDAENACDSMNGTELLGGKLRVELSRSRGRGGFRGSTGRSRGSFRGVGGGQGAGGARFGGRGRRGSQFGGRRGGGSARGGFRMSRDFSRRGRGHDGFVGGGNDYGDGSYGNGKVGCSNRSVYDGSSGATSRYRSRSPIGAGGGGARY